MLQLYFPTYNTHHNFQQPIFGKTDVIGEAIGCFFSACSELLVLSTASVQASQGPLLDYIYLTTATKPPANQVKIPKPPLQQAGLAVQSLAWGLHNLDSTPRCLTADIRIPLLRHSPGLCSNPAQDLGTILGPCNQLSCFYIKLVRDAPSKKGHLYRTPGFHTLRTLKEPLPCSTQPAAHLYATQHQGVSQ